MKIKILLYTLVLLCITTTSFAQITFEKGYFIDNNDQRIECLIRNVDWKNNPTHFEYKFTDADQVQQHDVTTVKEFGIIEGANYISANVQIDRSSIEISKLDKVKSPVWNQERLFLKVLIEGEATLYVYVDGNLERFFYKVADGDIQQLVYKRYLAENNITFGENNAFQQQLFAYVNCGNASINTFKRLAYKSGDLLRYFRSYNACVGSTVVDYGSRIKSDEFNLKLTVGINRSSVVVYDSFYKEYWNFDNRFNLRLGVEGEMILPFNKNKWSIVLEPNYQRFQTEARLDNNRLNLSLQSLEFPVGGRYYSYVSKDLKLFFNGFYISNFSLNKNSTLTFYDSQRNLIIAPKSSFAFGAGLGYKSLSAEFRYHTNRELLNYYARWRSDYTRVAIIVGYRLF